MDEITESIDNDHEIWKMKLYLVHQKIWLQKIKFNNF
jgi:hypothetical protein